MLFYNLIPKGGLMPPFDNPLFLKGALSVACGDSSPIGGAKSCLPRLAWRRVGKQCAAHPLPPPVRIESYNPALFRTGGGDRYIV